MSTATTLLGRAGREVCGARAQHEAVGRARVEVARHDGERAGVASGATRPAIPPSSSPGSLTGEARKMEPSTS
jgi:hypothetical protein